VNLSCNYVRKPQYCSFDPSSPRITTYDIYEWIYASLQIPEHNVQMIQIDGIKRQVYTKMVDNDCVLAVLRDTGSQTEYTYPSGELSIVNLALAGVGTKRIRIANLPPEVSRDTLGQLMYRMAKLLIFRTRGGLRLIDMLWQTVYDR